jgi:hypothetical protein
MDKMAMYNLPPLSSSVAVVKDVVLLILEVEAEMEASSAAVGIM